MKDIRERKCGCIYFQVGPPVLCSKHEIKEAKTESSAIRRAAREHATHLGHDLTDWSEYESVPGKWTSYCRTCGLMAITYDSPALTLGDQILGHALTKECR